MAKPWRSKQPTFWWQAALILLPVGILVAIGLWTLRQDRLLAQQEARAQAQSLTSRLNSNQWPAKQPSGFNVFLGFPRAIDRAAASPPSQREKNVDNVATRSHIKRVTRKKVKSPAHKVKRQILKEAALATLPPTQLVNVRTAKDQLSSLLERAAGGDEVIITSDGVPKAKLVPFRSTRKPFRMDWAHLRSMKVKPGAKSAEELVRADRDGRA